MSIVNKVIIKPTEKVNSVLRRYNTNEIRSGVKLSDLIKRSELSYEKLEEIDEDRPKDLDFQVKQEVGIQIKYDGYIKIEEQEVERFKKLEEKLLPKDIDYEEIKGLRIEARQKLNKVKPESIGQASRISGVSPADISVLLIYLETLNRGKKN